MNTSTVIYEGADTTKTIETATYVRWHDQYLEVTYHPDAPRHVDDDTLRQYGSESLRIPLARVVEVQADE